MMMIRFNKKKSSNHNENKLQNLYHEKGEKEKGKHIYGCVCCFIKREHCYEKNFI